ncbi:MAG: butyrate kinase [Spirochaetales bacterium]|nr:butyrate kinase [Spirochaetales bacterium]
MAEKIQLLAVNPGSTSTKIAVFIDQEKVFGKDIIHQAEKLDTFKEISDQFEYRRDMITEALEAEGYKLEDFTAFVGRGGGLNACAGGTYEINEQIINHATTNSNHPATLGSIISDSFAKKYGKRSFIVNPPDVDEFEPVARVTGIAEVIRESRIHSLSHKEVGLRAAEQLGKKYEDCNFLIAHIGGGISVAAHKKGLMVDGTDLLTGDCPMAPTRSGFVPPGWIVKMCFSGKYNEKEMSQLLRKNGGLVDHLGTSDVLEVKDRIAKGDKYAKLIYDAMIYQVAKTIGSYAPALCGEVDAVVLTGGISRDENLVAELKKSIGFLGDVIVFPGEFEMEALANGAYRVLTGVETPLVYTGDPIWGGYEAYK